MAKATAADLERARRRIGPIERREMRLAFGMLSPTVAAVLLVVLIPVLANFWISVKPIELADLRAAKPLVRERVQGEVTKPGDAFEVRYRARSSAPSEAVREVVFTHELPSGVTLTGGDDRCAQTGAVLRCDVGVLEPRARVDFNVTLSVDQAYFDAGAPSLRDTDPEATGKSKNALTSFEFTFENFRKVFDASEFWDVLWVSIVYTIGGTGGALLLGLFAAQLMMVAFPGRGIMRGLFLFPYVSPVIAVAFTWIFLLDPFSGTMNAILTKTGVTDGNINFLGQRGIALWTVIAFEAWRYFPLAFLFILARMQSLSSDLNEAAEMDGATPFQKFWYISLPQLVGIISTLFLLRFIWTFNKFDDIFLLTGGASGTRTLTVNVYEQAFALSNLGAGAAVAVVIFFMLAIFLAFYFKFVPKEEGM
ncbi:MAG: sugar ABC transporter permease [Rhodobacter sp.]|nr:sugar ABC transporter permease [Rhodobacter sp.]